VFLVNYYPGHFVVSLNFLISEAAEH